MTSCVTRSLVVLAVLAGFTAASPGPARADSIGLGLYFSDGDRADRRHHGRRHHRESWHYRDSWREHGRHRRHGPPPWAYVYPHRPGHPHARPYARHCWMMWSHWHQGFVRVCR